MQRSISIFATAICMSFLLVSFAQPMPMPGIPESSLNYRNTAAILIDGQILDMDYFRENKPRVMKGMTGILTVASVSSSGGCSLPINNISFQVAIKNVRTNTMYIYTREQVMSLDIEALLKKCEEGDRIVIMPAEQQYALPRNEMWVGIGC